MIISKMYAIALSEVDLVGNSFYTNDIHAPNQATFVDHSIKVPRATAGQGLHGYAKFTALWLAMDKSEGWFIKDMADQALATPSQELYMIVPRHSGVLPGQDWIKVKGVPFLPDLAPATNMYKDFHYPNVQFTLNNVIILGEVLPC